MRSVLPIDRSLAIKDGLRSFSFLRLGSDLSSDWAAIRLPTRTSQLRLPVVERAMGFGIAESHGRQVSVGWNEAGEPPSAGFRAVAPNRNKLPVAIGSQCQANLIEREYKARAHCLQHGLLLRPTVKEHSRSMLGRGTKYRASFLGGKVSLDESWQGFHGTELFDVHPHLAFQRHGYQGKIARVRQVETNRRAFRGQLQVRFAIRPGSKDQLAWVGLKILAEDDSQRRVCHREPAPMPFGPEPRGTLAFTGRKYLGESFQSFPKQFNSPKVELIGLDWRMNVGYLPMGLDPHCLLACNRTNPSLRCAVLIRSRETLSSLWGNRLPVRDVDPDNHRLLHRGPQALFAPGHRKPLQVDREALCFCRACCPRSGKAWQMGGISGLLVRVQTDRETWGAPFFSFRCATDGSLG